MDTTQDNAPRLKKNMFLLVVLTISAASIYMLPYFRSFYYEAFRDAFGMTNEETGLAGTYFGLLGVFSYFVGGIIADKVSIKILIPGSLLVSGGLGLVLLTSPSPTVIIAIHGIWGITSLMTFWPALIKALRLVGNSNEQSRAFGIFEGGRGITNAIAFSVAAALFAAFAVAGTMLPSVKAVLVMYSAIPITMGVLSIILLRNVNTSSASQSGGINFKLLGSVIANPRVWLMSLIILCAYTMNMSNYYVAPYASAIFSVSPLIAGIMSSSSQYIRPFAAMGAGVLGDKFNASKVMLVGLITTFLGMGVVYITPQDSTIILILAGLLIIFASMYVTQSMHFAIMEETKFPPEASGTIIGLVCTIGYLPEAFVPYTAGIILDNFAHDEVAGYRLIFVLIMAITAIGIALTLVWLKQTKQRRLDLLQERKAAVIEKSKA